MSVFNLNYQYIIMKLHLPIALLAAVLSTIAYGENLTESKPYTYTYEEQLDEKTGEVVGKTTFTGNGYNTVIENSAYASYRNPNSGTTYISMTGAISGIASNDTDRKADKIEINITGDGTWLDIVAGAGPTQYTVTGEKKIIVSDKAYVGEIYGTSYERNLNTNGNGNTIIEVSGGGIVGTILGAGFASTNSESSRTVNGNISISVDDSVVGRAVNGETGKVGSTGYPFSILGGGYYGVSVNGSVTIELSGKSEINGTIYGGTGTGKGKAGSVKSTLISIADDSVVTGNVYGGGYNIDGGKNYPTVSGDSQIVLEGGSVTGNVYGAGNGDIIEGNTRVVIRSSGTDVTGNIYGGGTAGAEVLGDRILAFDNYTANTGADGYAQVKWVKDDSTQQYQGFNALEVSNGNVNLGTISSEYDQLAVTNGSAKLDKLIVGADKSFDINGSGRDTSSVIITGAGANTDADNEETFQIAGKVNVSDTTLKMQNSITQLAIGNRNAGAEMTISNSYVDLREANSVIVGYDDYSHGKLTVTNGSTFLGAYNNAWLLMGEVEVSGNSVMEVCNTGSSNNYRTLIGGWETGMKITVKDSSSFTSGASQLVLNYGSQHDVTISVQGEGSTFTQKEYAGNKESVTYICNAGTKVDGEAYASFNNVSSTIEAIDGGKVDIQSKTTYIGDARDKGKYGETLNKTANFVVGKDSSISFRQMEVYADTNINFTDAFGVFSATGVNLYDGATMNIEKAGSVSLGDVAVGDGAKLNVSGTTLVFTEGGNITVANGGSLTLDNVAFELVLGDVSEDYSLTEYKDFSVTVMSGLENLTDENGLAFFKNLESANLDISIKGLVDGKLVDMNTYGVEFVYDQATGTASIKGSASIPEPTTATLSLLALAALAARRRRK